MWDSFFYWGWRLSPWFTFVVALLLAVERAYWSVVPMWLTIVSAVVAGIAAIGQSASIYYHRRQWASNQIQSLVSEIKERLGGSNTRVRCNVMTYDRRSRILRIKWHDTIDPDRELRLPWSLGQGCSGEACRRLRPVAQDLPAVLSVDDLRGPDGQIEWGLSVDHWRLTRDLRSIVCVPIRQSGHRDALGALNVDSTLPLSQSGLAEPAAVELLRDYYAPLLARLLEYRGN